MQWSDYTFKMHLSRLFGNQWSLIRFSMTIIFLQNISNFSFPLISIHRHAMLHHTSLLWLGKLFSIFSFSEWAIQYRHVFICVHGQNAWLNLSLVPWMDGRLNGNVLSCMFAFLHGDKAMYIKYCIMTFSMPFNKAFWQLSNELIRMRIQTWS